MQSRLALRLPAVARPGLLALRTPVSVPAALRFQTPRISRGLQIHNPSNALVRSRGFHSTQPAQKTLLFGGVAVAFVQGTRALVTALPFFYRWNWFSRYPKTMWTLASLPLTGTVIFVGLSYERHPLTQRGRLMLIDEASELKQSDEAFAELLQTYQDKLLPSSDPDVKLVHQVAADICAVVGPVRPWEVFVVNDDNIVNAFVIPSGKIFVFTGLMRVTPSLDAFAAVLSHELAHVLSRHSGETQGIQYITSLVFNTIHSTVYSMTVNLPFVGDIVGMSLKTMEPIVTDLPYSRMCETEADTIGLYLMAMAGYNPKGAVDFWVTLDELQKQSASANEDDFEFLSTHPSHEHRATNMTEQLDSALAVYEARNKLIESLKEKPIYHELKSSSERALAVDSAIEKVDHALFEVLAKHISKEEPFWWARKDTLNDIVSQSHLIKV
ncbi:peptidase family M48-domain-containing protein [Polychytrium aggregatum]|uniref:peptidase family M48-domain-containing protein n=1 Tax=Polychytrium aggregatum TaxID=110093 RepID=UPI0022FEFB65|nr:peptidase family M48-domain-containing protein [Polychytrium aggregatum]KAI9193573.1 peptidase family M48-domain-containing protein [Polychytrium aggregatum]